MPPKLTGGYRIRPYECHSIVRILTGMRRRSPGGSRLPPYNF